MFAGIVLSPTVQERPLSFDRCPSSQPVSQLFPAIIFVRNTGDGGLIVARLQASLSFFRF